MTSRKDDTSLKEKPGGVTGRRMHKSADALIAAAREYFGNHFSNPDGEGCPPPGTISALVHSGKPLEESLLTHLFACSACFHEHQRAMSGRSTDLLSGVAWWNLRGPIFGTWRAQILTATCAVGILFIALFVWRAHTVGPTSDLAANIPGPDKASSSGPTPGNSNESNAAASAPEAARDSERARVAATTSTARGGSSEKRARDLVALNSIRINLDERSILRDADNAGTTGEQSINLPASRNRLLLNLPEGSSNGLYEVNIVDAYGQPLVKGKGLARDGKSIVSTLDMRSLAAKKYRLCLSHGDESPDCYPISVKRSNASGQSRRGK
jgi:hypothetical protein